MNRRGRRALLILASSAAGLSVLAAGGVALSAGGSADGGPPIAPGPVLRQREVLTLIAGRVDVRVKGASAFASLPGTLTVVDGSEVDATNGRVAVTVATPQEGQTATALVYRGRFVLHQDPVAPAETHFTLSAPL